MTASVRLSARTLAAPLPAAAAPPRPHDDPAREVSLGAWVIGVFVVGGLLLSAVAPMDAAVVASGSIIASGHRQPIQARDPGTVQAILIREGAHVAAGQVLVRIADSAQTASADMLRARVIAKQAQIARLEADSLSQARITSPAAFAALPPQDRALASDALQREQALLTSQRLDDGMRTGALDERLSQAQSQLAGLNAQLTANLKRQALSEQTLGGMRKLLAQGFASANQIASLESDQANLQGQEGDLRAQIERLKGAAKEAGFDRGRGSSSRRQAIWDELSTAKGDLAALAPQEAAARDQVERGSLRAPVSGAVFGLKLNTVGAVVAAGQPILELVPDSNRLVIEVHVASRSADGLRAGAAAQVRFPSLHDRSLPVIHGQVTRVSADAFTEEKTGASYYVAEVQVPDEELTRINRGRAIPITLRKGTPAEVFVSARKRTALQYLTEPLATSFRHAFREG